MSGRSYQPLASSAHLGESVSLSVSHFPMCEMEVKTHLPHRMIVRIIQPCPGGGLSRQPTAHPHLLTPLLAKGLLSLLEPWWDCRTVLRRASSLLPLQRPRQVGRASQAGRVRGASSRAFPPSPGPARGRGRKAEPGAQPPSSCAPGPSVWGEPHPQHIGRGRGRESGQWGSPGAGDLRISQ